MTTTTKEETPEGFERVCNLRNGDRIIVNGTWRVVFFINAEVVKFHSIEGKGKNVSSLGKKSQQFVQVVKNNQ